MSDDDDGQRNRTRGGSAGYPSPRRRRGVSTEAGENSPDLPLRALRALQLETWTRRFTRYGDDVDAYLEQLDRTEAFVEEAAASQRERIVAGMDKLQAAVEAQKRRLLDEHAVELARKKASVRAERERMLPDLKQMRRLCTKFERTQSLPSGHALLTVCASGLDDVRDALAARPTERAKIDATFRAFSANSVEKLIGVLPFSPPLSRTEAEQLTLARHLAQELTLGGLGVQNSHNETAVSNGHDAPPHRPSLKSIAGNAASNGQLPSVTGEAIAEVVKRPSLTGAGAEAKSLTEAGEEVGAAKRTSLTGAEAESTSVAGSAEDKADGEGAPDVRIPSTADAAEKPTSDAAPASTEGGAVAAEEVAPAAEPPSAEKPTEDASSAEVPAEGEAPADDGAKKQSGDAAEVVPSADEKAEPDGADASEKPSDDGGGNVATSEPKADDAGGAEEATKPAEEEKPAGEVGPEVAANAPAERRSSTAAEAGGARRPSAAAAKPKARASVKT